MVFVLLELLVELTLKDHLLELVFVALDSLATMAFAPVVLQEPFGAQLLANVSMFVGKIQHSQPLLILVFVMMGLDY